MFIGRATTVAYYSDSANETRCNERAYNKFPIDSFHAAKVENIFVIQQVFVLRILFFYTLFFFSFI
jgi:hypothetical protein